MDVFELQNVTVSLTNVSLTSRVERHFHAKSPQIQHPLLRAGRTARHKCIYHLLHPLETAPGGPPALGALSLSTVVSAVRPTNSGLNISGSTTDVAQRSL